DRVATLMWNNSVHLAAYFAVPSMGAILHALHLRLAPEQLSWIINHAEDRGIVVDEPLVPLLAPPLPRCGRVDRIVASGAGGPGRAIMRAWQPKNCRRVRPSGAPAAARA